MLPSPRLLFPAPLYGLPATVAYYSEPGPQHCTKEIGHFVGEQTTLHHTHTMTSHQYREGELNSTSLHPNTQSTLNWNRGSQWV